MLKINRYTKEQEEIILNNAYKKTNKLSYQELADMLGRTVEGIRKKELDLKRKYLHNNRIDENKWTEEEENTIREELIKGDYSISSIHKKIKGKDIRLIEAKALELSVAINKDNKAFSYWTKEEEEYLRKWYGIERPIIIGINIGRSLESIHQKAKKMKLGGKKIYYSARECSALLGMSDTRFINYIYKGYIKSRRATTEQLIHQIKMDDLHGFMQNHQDKWDSRNLSYEPFLIEKPDWYIEKCKRDRENPIGYLDYSRKWAKEELDILFDRRLKGVSFADIAKELNRTIGSVANRYRAQKYIDEKRKTRQEENNIKDTVNRLKEEMSNERAYIVRKAYKITKRKLSDDDLEMISNLRMVGLKKEEINNILGVGDRYVCRILRANKDNELVINIKQEPLTEVEKQEIFDKANEGYSIYELCMEYNKDYPYIIKSYEEIMKNRIDDKDNKWTEKDIEAMLKYKEQGLTYRQIAYKLSKTESSVKNKYCVYTKRNK